MTHDLLTLFSRLSEAEGRLDAARALARRLGGEDLLIFVLDREVGALLPAPGFPQTLPRGRAWRAFLERCTGQEGRQPELPFPEPQEAELPYPELSGVRRVRGVTSEDGSVLAIAGGSPDLAAIEEVRLALPLLAATFRAEQRARVGRGHTTVARAAAQQAEALASSLAATQSELRAALCELQETDRRKDQFLAMLAHELRNPLAPLVTALHLLRVRPRDEAGVERAVEIANRQVQQMARLVDDLLDVSRITRGKIELRTARHELRTLIARAMECVQPHVASRRHQISVTVPEEPLWLFADAVRIEQILTNLLNNAIKYTDPGGRIEVLVERNGSEAIFRVKDTGIGISPSLLPRIFDLFMQADRSLDRSQGGLGIGLTLVRMLVEMHGGTVAVESAGEGHGSEFTVRLPLADGPAEGESAAANVATPTSRRDGRALRRVLVVDDNVDAADMLAEAIRALGHDVRLAHDGPSAINVAESFAPEVVFLDIGLPGMDGYEVALRLRRPPLAPMTLVALTGYGRDADKLRAREAGFDRHLVKPVDIDVVEKIVTGEDGAQTYYRRVSPEQR